MMNEQYFLIVAYVSDTNRVVVVIIMVKTMFQLGDNGE